MKITNIELDQFYEDLCIEVLALDKTNIIQKYQIDQEVCYLYYYGDGDSLSFKKCIIIKDEDIDKEVATLYANHFYVINKGQKFLNYEIRYKKKEAALHVAKNLGSMDIYELAKEVNAKVQARAEIFDVKLKLDF